MVLISSKFFSFSPKALHRGMQLPHSHRGSSSCHPSHHSSNSSSSKTPLILLPAGPPSRSSVAFLRCYRSQKTTLLRLLPSRCNPGKRNQCTTRMPRRLLHLLLLRLLLLLPSWPTDALLLHRRLPLRQQPTRSQCPSPSVKRQSPTWSTLLNSHS